MNYDNPAARLLNLLQIGKQKAKNTTCRVVWEELLDTQGNPPLLMSRLGKVMELPQLIIGALQESFPDQGNTWAHWEGQVNAGFMTQNLNATWESFVNHIDEHTIIYLRMTADLLAARSNTKLIADDSLDSIRKDLLAVLNQVLESDQPSEVKKYIVRNLRRMIASIEEYRLTGALPLLDAIDTTIGHMVFDKEYKSFLRDTELGKRLLDTLASMANVVTVAVGIPQLSLAIAQLTN